MHSLRYIRTFDFLFESNCFDDSKYIFFSLRELDFIKRQEAERKKIEDLEKAHLVEVQGLQARVSSIYSHI